MFLYRHLIKHKMRSILIHCLPPQHFDEDGPFLSLISMR